MMRVVVADDETLARRKLRQFLEKHDDIDCVGEATDGAEAVQLVNELRPDVLFLDIRMPGVSGLEVVERVREAPHVVFTTAYDKYAVTAFELQALDYLLKPFGEERFEKTLLRVRHILREGGQPDFSTRAQEAIGESKTLTRFFVRKRGQIVPINVRDVQLLVAGDEYVTLHVGGEKFLVSTRLRILAERLDPDRFIQVHRSYIVNLDYVRAMTPYDGARLQIELMNGNSVVASRTRSKELRKLVV